MPSPLQRYSPSGFFRPLAIVYFVAAIAAGCALAFVYQAIVRWISIVQLKMVVVLFFAFGLGFAGGWVMRAGHCRNRLLALLFALSLAGVPLAATYYWDYQLAGPGHIRIRLGDHGVSTEYTFRDYLEDRQRYGWSMKKGGTITGWGVLALWTLEGVVVFSAVLLMTVGVAGEPYCEKCGRYCASRGFKIAGVGREAVAPLLEAGALDRVIALEAAPSGPSDRTLWLSLSACPGCKSTGFLTVGEQHTTTKKGKTSTSSATLISNAVLSTANREAVERRLTDAVGQKLPAA
jgi:hypothetical protein